MINEVSYKHCVCDMCGKEIDITITGNRPHDWENVYLQYERYDLCKECTEKIVGVIKNEMA